jgi:hypothetical protein
LKTGFNLACVFSSGEGNGKTDEEKKKQSSAQSRRRIIEKPSRVCSRYQGGNAPKKNAIP